MTNYIIYIYYTDKSELKKEFVKFDKKSEALKFFDDTVNNPLFNEDIEEITLTKSEETILKRERL